VSPSVTRKKTQGSRAERRDQIRHALLDAVEQLLEEGESFTELSVERLVSRAQISRSTFYVYFEDKGDLLSAWLTEIISELTAAAGPVGRPGVHRDLLAHERMALAQRQRGVEMPGLEEHQCVHRRVDPRRRWPRAGCGPSLSRFGAA